MRAAFVIFRRELLSVFATVRGYLVLATFSAVVGFYFFNVLGRYNFLVSRAAGMQLDPALEVPTLQEFVVVRFLQLVLMSLVVFIPLLTMRSFAEERQQQTFVLLRNSPSGVVPIVIGKFLAILTILLFMVMISAGFLSVLLVYGSPDRGSIVAGLVGLFLCGAFYVAVGLAVGSRTDQQLSAAIGGLVVTALLSLLHTPVQLIPTLRPTLGRLAPFTHFDVFTRGVIPLAGTSYFILGTALALVGCCWLLNWESTAGSARQPSLFFGPAMPLSVASVVLFSGLTLGLALDNWSDTIVWTHLGIGLIGFAVIGYGLTMMPLESRLDQHANVGAHAKSRATSPLFIRGLFAVVTLLCMAHCLRTQRYWDFSDARQNTLSDYSLEIVKRTSQPLVLNYFSERDADFDRKVERKLAMFSRVNPDLISVRMIDGLVSAGLIHQLGLRAGERLAVVYGSGSERRIVRLRNLDEQSLVGAILSLVEANPKHVIIASGLGLPAVMDTSALGISKIFQVLTGENWQVQSVPLEQLSTERSENTVLIILGLREPLTEDAQLKLSGYVANGGRVFVTLDPLFSRILSPLLGKLGIYTDDSIVLDRDQIAEQPGAVGLQPLVRSFAQHPITNSLGRNRALILNAVTPVIPATDSNTTFPLFFSSAGSVTEPHALDVLNGQPVGLQSAPSDKPISLATATVGLNQRPHAVVIGDTDWVLNGALDYFANRALLLNSVHWLLGEDWALQTRGASMVGQSVAISAEQLRWVIALSVILVEALVLFGLLRVRSRTMG